ncbi:MAG: hypothetical protein PWR18_962 [Synergistales bacterium]|nr:hypothetical protein [Synergistales bacterium]
MSFLFTRAILYKVFHPVTLKIVDQVPEFLHVVFDEALEIRCAAQVAYDLFLSVHCKHLRYRPDPGYTTNRCVLGFYYYIIHGRQSVSKNLSLPCFKNTNPLG